MFQEALRFHVTLLTFSHLQFMLQRELPSADALIPLWEVSSVVQQAVGGKPGATQYWLQADRVFCAALQVDLSEWKSARRRYFGAMLEVADRQIGYFEQERERVRSLTREALAELALNALKLDNKIEVIKAKKQKALALLNTVEAAED